MRSTNIQWESAAQQVLAEGREIPEIAEPLQRLITDMTTLGRLYGADRSPDGRLFSVDFDNLRVGITQIHGLHASGVPVEIWEDIRAGNLTLINDMTARARRLITEKVDEARLHIGVSTARVQSPVVPDEMLVTTPSNAPATRPSRDFRMLSSERIYVRGVDARVSGRAYVAEITFDKMRHVQADIMRLSEGETLTLRRDEPIAIWAGEADQDLATVLLNPVYRLEPQSDDVHLHGPAFISSVSDASPVLEQIRHRKEWKPEYDKYNLGMRYFGFFLGFVFSGLIAMLMFAGASGMKAEPAVHALIRQGFVVSVFVCLFICIGRMTHKIFGPEQTYETTWGYWMRSAWNRHVRRAAAQHGVVHDERAVRVISS